MNCSVLSSMAICVFLVSAVFGDQDVHITAAQPTHYFYTPTAYVNPANHLVVSLHEVSFGLPEHLQVQASTFDNVGRVDFGAKYGLTDNLAIGAGTAWTLATFEPGFHGIKHDDSPRFGAYICYGFVRNSRFEAAITGHMQLFNHNSIGCDFGLMATPSSMWSIIGEVGTSIDFTDNPASFWFNMDGGLRIHPPSIPFLNFDGGIDIVEFKVNVPHASTFVRPYIDVIFAMVTTPSGSGRRSSRY